VLDSSSEVKLRQGVFQEAHGNKSTKTTIAVEPIPEAEDKAYGRMFRFRQSVAEGFRDIFLVKKRKKGRMALIVCMVLFGATFVFLTALFGNGVRQRFEVRKKYNDHVLFVSAYTEDIGERLLKLAADPESAIDYIGVGRCLYQGLFDSKAVFEVQNFETIGRADNGVLIQEKMKVPLTILPAEISEDAELLCGSRELQTEDEVLISRQVADILMEKAYYSYMDGYERLLGTGFYMNTDYEFRGNSYIITGVLDTKENAAYVNKYEMARIQSYVSDFIHNTLCDREGYFGVKPGECLILENPYFFSNLVMDVNYDSDSTYSENVETGPMMMLPKLKTGDTVWYSGIALSVKDCRSVQGEEEKHLSYPFERYKSGARLDSMMNQRFLVILSEEDYLRGAAILGKTTACLNGNNAFESCPKEIVFTPGDSFQFISEWESFNPFIFDSPVYYVIHSTDPEVTSGKLEKEFATVRSPEGELSYTTYEWNEDDESQNSMYVDGYNSYGVYEPYKSVYTESDRFEYHFRSIAKVSKRFIVIWIGMIVLLSLCMFFLMKSIIMSREKEIGIYRAIGVTKKNVWFRYMTESISLVTFTVMIGYLAASIAVLYSLHVSSTAYQYLFYPWWVALGVLVVLYIIGIIVGMLTLFGVLRRTPSEILAKYDI